MTFFISMAHFINTLLSIILISPTPREVAGFRLDKPRRRVKGGVGMRAGGYWGEGGGSDWNGATEDPGVLPHGVKPAQFRSGGQLALHRIVHPYPEVPFGSVQR